MNATLDVIYAGVDGFEQSAGDLLLDKTGVHFEPYRGDRVDVPWAEVRRLDVDGSSTRPAKGSFRRSGLIGMLTQREQRAVITVATNAIDHVFSAADDLDSCRVIARRVALDVHAARGRIYVEGRPV